jgi:hypothetical protein
VHHPVVDKNGATIASAVTNLDLHDIARASRTYGVEVFYVVTPLEDQKELVGRILDHWFHGVGASYNPSRRQALELIDLKESLDQVRADVEVRCQRRPMLVATSARFDSHDLTYADLRRKLKEGLPAVLIFGTAWGLAEDVIQGADYRLAPLRGALSDGYNHLSVRSAAAIILDRLMCQTS